MTISPVAGFVKAFQMNGLIRFSSLVFGVAVLLQCDSNSGGLTDAPITDCNAPDCNVSSVMVSPANATVFEGLSIKFTATARDASGHIVTGVTVDWEVSDSAVAEIDSTGRLRSKKAGIVQVRAIANGKVGSVDLVVVDATVASLEIVVAQPSLLVNESALFTVKVRNAAGAEIPTPLELLWTSSDEAIARVSAGGRTGVVTGLRRGTVTINVSAGNVGSSVSLRVKARVAIGRLDLGYFTPANLPIGDTLRFAAFFVDVNGARIDEAPSVAWASGNPDVASVSPTGLVTGLRTGLATITATNSDGRATMEVTVIDFIVGLPAKVRLAHVSGGYGPLTFVPNQGASVTLTFGESVEVPVVSGRFIVHVVGSGYEESGSLEWLIRGGDRLEIFATSYGVTGWWINKASVPADSGLVRFVQGTGPPNFAGVVLLGAPGATAAGSRLIHCYFDPYEITEYISVPGGELEVIMGDKGLFFNLSDAAVLARGRITVTPGRAVTYVLTGESPQTMSLLAFPAF